MSNPRVILKKFFRVFSRTLYIYVFIFLVFTYLFAMLLGIYFFYFTEKGAFYSSQFLVNGIPIVLAPFGGDPWWNPLFVTVGWRLTLGWIFAGLWLVLCACFLLAWAGPFEDVKKGVLKLKDLSLHQGNFLLMFPLFASLAYSSAFLLESVLLPNIGVPSGPVLPEISPHVRFLILTNSSVTEEIGFRLVPLGFLSLFLFLAHKPNRKILKSISWKKRIWVLLMSLIGPNSAKNKFVQQALTDEKNKADPSIRRSLSKIEYAFLFISSVLFGLGHLGWGKGNAVSAFATSVLFGYTYFIYGIAASILLHWFFNYYFTVYYYTSSYFPFLHYINDISFFIHIFLGFTLWALLIINLISTFSHQIGLWGNKIRRQHA